MSDQRGFDRRTVLAGLAVAVLGLVAWTSSGEAAADDGDENEREDATATGSDESVLVEIILT